jgi:hypothetical protein
MSYDLLVFHDNGEGRPMSLSLLGDTAHGMAVTGILKGCQRFFLELFTVSGSLRGLPHRGCPFMQDAWSGLWQTPSDVQASFAASLMTIRQNLRADILDADPAEERFADAQLLDVQTVKDATKLFIRYVSAAGTARVVEAPVPFSAISRRQT